MATRTNFDGVGQSQFGGPAGPGVLPATTGKYIYVHHTGSATSVGLNSKVPVVTTIDGAIGKTRANKNDIVVVLPGHAESITAAGGITLDVASTMIYGLGTGNARPVVTIASTDNSGSVAISANNCSWFNVVVVGNDDALTNAFNITGNNFRGFIETQDTSAAVEMATAIRLDTADGADLTWKHVGFAAGNAMTSGVILDTCVNVNLHVDFKGKASLAVVDMQDGASSDVLVTGYMYNSGTTDATKDVTDTVTGSTWAADIFDGAAGYKVSGGSAAALAADDVSAVAAAVAVVDGYQDVPSADATANAQVRDVVGNKTDAAVQTAGTQNSAIAYLKGILGRVNGTGSNYAYNPLLGIQVQTTAADKLDGVQNACFTISGGKVLITAFYLETSVGAIDAETSNLSFISNPTVGTDLTFATNLDINADEAGSIYSCEFDGTAVTGGSGGGANVGLAKGLVVDVGTIDIVTSTDAAQSNSPLVQATIYYFPLELNATIAAAF